MSCPISSGITKTCGWSQGGNKRVYLANADEVTGLTKVDGIITAIAMSAGAVFYEIEFEDNTSNFIETLTVGTVARFVNQILTMSLSDITANKVLTLDDIALGSFVAICQEQNDRYWLLQENGSGLRANGSMVRDTGTASSDDNIFTIALEGGNNGYSVEVADGLIDTLV